MLWLDQSEYERERWMNAAPQVCSVAATTLPRGMTKRRRGRYDEGK